MKTEIEVDLEIGDEVFFLRRLNLTDGRSVCVPWAGAVETIHVKLPRPIGGSQGGDIYGVRFGEITTAFQRSDLHIQAISALKGAMVANDELLKPAAPVEPPAPEPLKDVVGPKLVGG